MPDPHALQQLWRHSLEQFRVNLLRLQRRITPGAVHDIRVAIKKLRACLSWMNGTTASGMRPFDTIRTFYRESGHYRDAQVQLDQVRTIEKEEGLAQGTFTLQLRLLRTIATRAMRKTVRGKALEDSLSTCDQRMQELLTRLSPEEATGRVRHAIRNGLSQTRPEAKKFRQHAHTIRKHLKQVYYGLSVLTDPLFSKKQTLKQLEEGLNDLGQWHDLELLHKRMRAFRRQHIVPETAEALQLKRMEQAVAKRRDRCLAKGKAKLLPLPAVPPA